MTRRRIGWFVIIGTAVLLLTLIGGSISMMRRTRQMTVLAAGSNLQTLSLAVTSTLNRQLLQVDGALVNLPTLFAAANRQSGETDMALAQRLLQAFNFETFLFRDLLLVRPDGTVWASARPRRGNLPLPLDNATHNPGTAMLGGPLYNAATGEWSWYLSRPVNLPGIGPLMAVAEIPLSATMAILASSIAMPEGVHIIIERSDGLRLASVPYDGLTIGKRMVAISSLDRDEGQIFRLPNDSSIIAVWRNSLYPDLQVALTIDLTPRLVDWARDSDHLLYGVIVACLLVLGIAVTSTLALRQHERVEQGLINEKKLEADLLRARQLEAIGRFTAGVAHDFNNLLQEIITTLELLKEDIPDRPDIIESVDAMLEAADHGGELTRQMLSFARQQVLRPTALDLHEFLSKFHATLCRIISPHIRLHVVTSPGLVVNADAAHLHTGLLNLAINARDAMPEGGDLRIEATRDTASDQAVIRVCDTGIGMTPEILARVCEPFFTTKGSRGTGLGLPMVYGFAKQSGGDLRISSEPGKGTCVEVWLPLR